MALETAFNKVQKLNLLAENYTSSRYQKRKVILARSLRTKTRRPYLLSFESMVLKTYPNCNRAVWFLSDRRHWNWSQTNSTCPMFHRYEWVGDLVDFFLCTNKILCLSSDTFHWKSICMVQCWLQADFVDYHDPICLVYCRRVCWGKMGTHISRSTVWELLRTEINHLNKEIKICLLQSWQHRQTLKVIWIYKYKVHLIQCILSTSNIETPLWFKITTTYKR